MYCTPIIQIFIMYNTLGAYFNQHRDVRPLRGANRNVFALRYHLTLHIVLDTFSIHAFYIIISILFCFKRLVTSQTFFFETLLGLTQISKLRFKPFLYDYAAQISDSYVSSSASKIFFSQIFSHLCLNYILKHQCIT